VPTTNSSRVFATAYDVSLETLQRKSYWEPEEKLMLAVLDDAIACFQKYAFARNIMHFLGDAEKNQAPP
jgi:hypothetical protein